MACSALHSAGLPSSAQPKLGHKHRTEISSPPTTPIPGQFCQPQALSRMESRSKNPPITSDGLPENKGGTDLRTATEIWVKLAESEARLHLMVELGYLEVGFPDVENFCLDLESKYRCTVIGELKENGKDSPEWKIVKLCMELKMIDERKNNGQLETARYKMRKKIEEELGKNSRRARNKVKNLRQEAARRKAVVMKKNEEKLKHLRRKFRTTEEDKMDHVPVSMAELDLDKLSI